MSAPRSGVVVDGVPSPCVPALWPAALPFVARALGEGGHLLPEDVLAALLRREMQLWAVWRDGALAGVLVTEIRRWPRRTVCRLALAAADDGARADWLPWRGRIEDWARAQGCDAIEIWGRPGWARLVKGARRRVALEWDL
jgi:hypothetical protein